MNEDTASNVMSLRHLQITFTPNEYPEILAKYTHSSIFGASRAGADYWERLPTYLISRCPFCNARYTGRLDTHSLAGGWMTHPDHWKAVYSEKHQQIECEHFVVIQTFVNLNGIVPTEVTYFMNHLDVPFVMPTFVPADLPSMVVMHSLPICRIEDNRFVPRYAAYMLTYYSLDPVALRARRRAENIAFGAGDPEYRGSALYTAGEANAHPEAWDLRQWVAHGNLCWLDPYVDGLPLRAGPPEALPYADVRGYRRPVTIREGKVILGY